MSRLLKYVILVFLSSCLENLLCDVYTFLSENVLDFKNLFLSLNLFIMALCSSLVINGVSFGDIRPKFLVVKIFIVPIVYYFRRQFLEAIFNSVTVNK